MSQPPRLSRETLLYSFSTSKQISAWAALFPGVIPSAAKNLFLVLLHVSSQSLMCGGSARLACSALCGGGIPCVPCPRSPYPHNLLLTPPLNPCPFNLL